MLEYPFLVLASPHTSHVMPDAPWYKDGLRFECTQCGRCCTGEPGYVWVTRKEINALSRKMGLSPTLFEQIFVYTVRGNKKSLKEHPNGDCVLLGEKTRGCNAYEDRPIQCKTWPFWDQNIISPRAWEMTAQSCPGCNRGRLYTLEEIEEQKSGVDFC